MTRNYNPKVIEIVYPQRNLDETKKKIMVNHYVAYQKIVSLTDLFYAVQI